MKRIASPIFIALIIIAFGSCKKDNNPAPAPVYTVPTTYNFDNVNTTQSLKLLLMADQIGAKINLANTSGVVVNAQDLKDMFNNVNNKFTDTSATLQLNSSGLKLADYVSAAAKTDILSYFDSVGKYSQSAVPASNGVAGVAASSANASKKYLLSPTGIFYSQVFKKAMNGALCSWSIIRYLTDSIGSSVDNTTVVAGTGTKLENNWDKAWGMFGVPKDFPTNKTGLRYVASYSNQVDAGLGSNAKLMNAFLAGRAAISAKDLNGMNKQALIIIKTLDSLNAACIVQEMKETDANVEAGDAVASYGTLSETLGFVRNFAYDTHSSRAITTAQIGQLNALFDASSATNPNLYLYVNAGVATKTQIEAKNDAIRQFIGKTYGFSAAQLAAQ